MGIAGTERRTRVDLLCEQVVLAEPPVVGLSFVVFGVFAVSLFEQKQAALLSRPPSVRWRLNDALA